MAAALITKSLIKILKPFAKKNPNDIFPAIEALKKIYGKNIYKSNTKKLKNSIGEAWKSKAVGGNPMESTFTGVKGGAKRYNPITKKWERYVPEETKLQLRESTLASPNAMKNLLIGQMKGDPTLKREGIEGWVKANVAGEESSLGTALSSDKASIKGILSMARAAMLRNPKKREQILRTANLKKYNEEIQPHMAQLDDVERQIRYWLAEGDKKDVAKIRDLMTRYADLKKSIDPRYWHARGMTWGHPAGLMANIKNVKAKGVGADLSDYLTSNPKALTRYDPEIGPLNIGKDPIDMTVLESISDPNIPVTRKGLSKMGDIYKQAGIRSIMPSPTGKKMILGEHNVEQQIDYLTKLLNRRQAPFAGLNKKEIQRILMGYNKGGVVNGYAAGGIGRLGIKMLQKLAKKMPEEDFLKVMETIWKGVDPKKSGRYRAWDKQRWGPGYKWPFKQSRIKGPGIKKSHYASLSEEAKEQLRKRYDKQIAEYIARKKN